MRLDVQRRNLPTGFEMRGDAGSGATLIGHAAVFDVETVIMGMFREKISPGSFKKTIKESDVRALFNHDPNFILGRNKADTLRLSEDKVGLAYEIDLPDTQTAKDLYTSIERGDVTQSSFAFKIVKEVRTEPDEEAGEIMPLFDIKETRLFDVSPVTYPAYDETDVQAYSEGDEIGYGVAIKRFAEFCARPVEEVRQFLEEHGGDDDRDEMLVRLWLPYTCEYRTFVPFQNLPVVEAGGEWDPEAARARVKEWAGGDVAKYRQAFCLYDAASGDSYDFQIADVRNDELVVVPEGVYKAAESLTDDDDALRRHLGKYYRKMGEDVPWGVRDGEFATGGIIEGPVATVVAQNAHETIIPLGTSSREALEEITVHIDVTESGGVHVTASDALTPNDEPVEPPVDEESDAERSDEDPTLDEADTLEPPAAEERADTLDDPDDSTDEPTAEDAEPLTSRARVRSTLSTF